MPYATDHALSEQIKQIFTSDRNQDLTLPAYINPMKIFIYLILIKLLPL